MNQSRIDRFWLDELNQIPEKAQDTFDLDHGSKVLFVDERKKMPPLDVIKQDTLEDLKKLAVSHPTFGSFMHDMEKLAENTWHNARGQGEGLAETAETEAEQDVESTVTSAVDEAQHDLTASTPQPGPVEVSETPPAS